MYISVSDAATKFNISRRRVQLLCEQGRISGANMIDGVWLIPETLPSRQIVVENTLTKSNEFFQYAERRIYNR